MPSLFMREQGLPGFDKRTDVAQGTPIGLQAITMAGVNASPLATTGGNVMMELNVEGMNDAPVFS